MADKAPTLVRSPSMVEFATSTADDASAVSYSLTIRASETNLLGKSLAAIPAAPTEALLCARPHTQQHMVSRTFTVTVRRRSAAHQRLPRWISLILTYLVWFLSTASAAAALVYGVPLLRDHLASPGSILLGGAPRGNRLARGSTSFDRAASWAITDDAGAITSRMSFPSFATLRDLELATYGSALHPRNLAALFEPQTLATELAAYAAAAGRTLINLEAQLSPLTSGEQHTPVPQLAWMVAPKPKLDGVSGVVAVPVAAVSLAGAVAKVLSACAVPPPAVSAAGTCQTTPQASAREDASINLADAIAAAEVADAPTSAVDVERALLAARLATYTYHSCRSSDDGDDGEGGEAAAVLKADLAAEGLSLAADLHGDTSVCGDTNAYVAGNATHLFVLFRGSCTLRNAVTDVWYHDDGSAVEALEEVTGMRLPRTMRLHRGFVDAYLSLRGRLFDVLEAEAAMGARPILCSGHSMGGAMAMLAALDMEHARTYQQYACDGHQFGPVSTLTFGCPRVGCEAFARLWGRVFSRAEDHWALQAPSDAIPHLPFKSWGFRHPAGATRLHDATPSRLETDPGDSLEALRPREGRVKEWVVAHDLNEYKELLRRMEATPPREVRGVRCEV